MTWRLRKIGTAGVAAIALVATSLTAGTFRSASVVSPTRVYAASPSAVAAARLNALSDAQSKRSTRAMTDVHFILNWLPNVEFAGLWVAEKKGWFQSAGLHLSFKGWAPGVEPTTDVPQWNGDGFGFQSGAAIAIAVSQGVPIKALYTDTQKSVFGLTVLAKSNIHSLKDLKGRKVGYQSHEFYVPSTMLSYVGLKDSDWKPVQVGFDTSQLTSGQVDAYLTFLTNEPIALELQGVKTRSFAASNYGFHFYDDVLLTSNSLISKNPSLVRKVVGIVARGFSWAHTHPDAAARLTVANYFPAAKGASAKAVQQNLQQQIMELRTFTPFSWNQNHKFTGLMSASYWQDSVNTLAKYGEIKSKPSPASLFTNQFNPNR